MEEDEIKIQSENITNTKRKTEDTNVEKRKISYRDKFSKEKNQKIINFFSSKKKQWIAVGILLLIIIIFGSWMRVQNLNLLVDSTTGENIPIALDPFYFLRVAGTIIDNGGLPECDNLKILGDNCIIFSKEIHPQIVVLMWKVANAFGNYSIQYINIISPVIFFILGLIVFFFLIFSLTNSKIIALISSFLLTIIPSYLYRTMAGFSDHEAPGMLAFFSALLIFSYALKFLEKNKENNLLKPLLFGIGTGLFTAFTIASWGGISKFIFMIIPLSSLIFWIVNVEDKKERFMKNFLVFYSCWFVFSFASGFIFGFDIIDKFKASVLSSSGIATGFVLMFIFVDYIILKYSRELKKIAKNSEKYRVIYSLLTTIILGLAVLVVSGQDVLTLFKDILVRLLNPFGMDRLGLTVAENKQPYLNDWIGQVGKVIFYLFLAGLFFVGLNSSKNIKKHNHKILFVVSWVFLILGIIFSRISQTSMFDGKNFISGIFYAAGLLFFILSFIYIYLKKDLKISSQLILILSIMFFILIAGRGAARLFFVITPFMIFMVGYSIVNLYNYAKNSKEEITKILFFVGLGIAVLGLLIAVPGMISSSKYQGEHTGPSANIHWQNAMSWIRNNTAENSIFSHWWDYGYWIEYLGERPTIADGGHFQGTYRDHMIGRYILTEPNQNLSLSFMKSNKVNYLLIDQTDLGKYPAYSSIGSDSNWDRVDSISVMNVDSSQIRETAEGETRVYQGMAGVGDDIIYNLNGTDIFIPGAKYDENGAANFKAFIIGIILEIKRDGNTTSFEQPRVVFVYNGQQIYFPIKYIYYKNKKIEFENGLDAGVMIIPKINVVNNQVNIDNFGGLVYLSQRTLNSLFVQLYLLNDPDKKYETIKLAHSEENLIVSSLKSQGVNMDEFLLYQGFQGPIKIYEINYPEYILEKEEFTRRILNDWAEFDDLEVVG
jgi:asparagine N-glycosylation enzyme membrane subunit Stt3